jgi:hypothetical protein
MQTTVIKFTKFLILQKTIEKIASNINGLRATKMHSKGLIRDERFLLRKQLFRFGCTVSVETEKIGKNDKQYQRFAGRKNAK